MENLTLERDFVRYTLCSRDCCFLLISCGLCVRGLRHLTGISTTTSLAHNIPNTEEKKDVSQTEGGMGEHLVPPPHATQSAGGARVRGVCLADATLDATRVVRRGECRRPNHHLVSPKRSVVRLSRRVSRHNLPSGVLSGRPLVNSLSSQSLSSEAHSSWDLALAASDLHVTSRSFHSRRSLACSASSSASL